MCGDQSRSIYQSSSACLSACSVQNLSHASRRYEATMQRFNYLYSLRTCDCLRPTYFYRCQYKTVTNVNDHPYTQCSSGRRNIRTPHTRIYELAGLSGRRDVITVSFPKIVVAGRTVMSDSDRVTWCTGLVETALLGDPTSFLNSPALPSEWTWIFPSSNISLRVAYNFCCRLQQGVLNIIIPGRGTWVLNKQTPNRQVWWSSPIR